MDTPLEKYDMNDNEESDNIDSSMKSFPPLSHKFHRVEIWCKGKRDTKNKCKKSKCKIVDLSVEIPEINSPYPIGIGQEKATWVYKCEYSHEDAKFFS